MPAQSREMLENYAQWRCAIDGHQYRLTTHQGNDARMIYGIETMDVRTGRVAPKFSSTSFSTAVSQFEDITGLTLPLVDTPPWGEEEMPTLVREGPLPMGWGRF